MNAKPCEAPGCAAVCPHGDNICPGSDDEENEEAATAGVAAKHHCHHCASLQLAEYSKRCDECRSSWCTYCEARSFVKLCKHVASSPTEVCPHCFANHSEWQCTKCNRTAIAIRQKYNSFCNEPHWCGGIELVRGTDSLDYDVRRFVNDPNKALLRVVDTERRDFLYSNSTTAMQQACEEAWRLATEKLQQGFRFRTTEHNSTGTYGYLKRE